jgi:NDP-sugar pyrophosphorylase family protein
MRCVILAGGKGERLRPLTDKVPKPLVKVRHKALIDHVGEVLPSSIEEVILVIGHLGDQIRQHCGDRFHGRPVKYVVQEKQTGTAPALMLCKELLAGRFLFMFADDIHGAADIERATSFTRSMLVARSDHPQKFGVILRNPEGTLAEIIEKPSHPPSNLVSTGVMVLDTDVFNYYSVLNGGADEQYLTPILHVYAKEHPVAVVEQREWTPIATPEDVERANKAM